MARVSTPLAGSLVPVSDPGADQRALFRRWPAGVAVVVAEAAGRRAGLTVSSLLSLSLEPPLVAIALSRSASLYEVLREADGWAVSILAADQGHLAQHFARNVPPIALWNRVEVREDEPRLLAAAAGWILASTVDEVAGGDHTLFLGRVERLEAGPGAGSLVHLDGRYLAL
jgi:flavin reductase (DIM6/NTAB) family NADH-FMN oxidoreductase RutF